MGAYQVFFRAPSDIVYHRVAWTGGDTPRNKPLLTLCPDYIALAKWFLAEQVQAWAEYWHDYPDTDTFNVLVGRAMGDAWRTFCSHHGLNFAEVKDCHHIRYTLQVDGQYIQDLGSLFIPAMNRAEQSRKRNKKAAMSVERIPCHVKGCAQYRQGADRKLYPIPD